MATWCLRGMLVSTMDIHLCTDCKSLYDHLHKAGTPKPPTERRLALDLAAIRQSLMVEAKHQWKRLLWKRVSAAGQTMQAAASLGPYGQAAGRCVDEEDEASCMVGISE